MSSAVDYTDWLRRVAINDQRLVQDYGEAAIESRALDAKTAALVRLAALISVGGAVPSFGAQADAAVDAGATADEIVEILMAVIPVIGLPRVVAAAPSLALALGYDIDDAL